MRKQLAEPTWIFRPSDHGKPGTIRDRLREGSHQNYHFTLRRRGLSPFADGPLNRQVICRMHGRNHYLTGHAPDKVKAANRAMELFWDRRMRRFGNVYGGASSRVNQRGINGWL